jgi:hypothetical protein
MHRLQCRQQKPEVKSFLSLFIAWSSVGGHVTNGIVFVL